MSGGIPHQFWTKGVECTHDQGAGIGRAADRDRARFQNCQNPGHEGI
jgi:hypothetical protein